MPHYDKSTGDVVVRMTELISVNDCEQRGYYLKKEIEKIKEQKGKKTARGVLTISSLIGTIVHNEIENFLRQRIGLPAVPMNLSDNEWKFYEKVTRKERNRQYIEERINNAFLNFIEFYEKYHPEPLYIEKEVIGKIGGVSVKGSIDLVAKVDKGLFLRGKESGEEAIVIIDWKTGSSHLSSHRNQISGYYLLAMGSFLPSLLKETGLPYLTIDGKPAGIDVYLGGKTYKVKVFAVDEEFFLDTVERFKKAEEIPFNAYTQKANANIIYCHFCPYRDRCSVLWNGDVVLYDPNAENEEKQQHREIAQTLKVVF